MAKVWQTENEEEIAKPVKAEDGRKIRTIEIYLSLLGEGQRTGMPCVLFRTAYCPLRCSWCDTAYTSHHYKTQAAKQQMLLTPEEAFDEVAKFGCKRVLFTGGEPILEGTRLMELAVLLHNDGYELLMETSGAYHIKEWLDLIDIMDFDVKCPASGMQRTTKLDQIDYLRFQDEVKFVVHNEQDLEYAFSIIDRWRPKCSILISPTWESRESPTFWKWLWEQVALYAKKSPLNIRLQIQLHKMVFGNERLR